MQQEGRAPTRLEKLRIMRHFFTVPCVYAYSRRFVTSQGVTPKHHGLHARLALCSQKTDDWIEIVARVEQPRPSLSRPVATLVTQISGASYLAPTSSHDRA